LKQEGITTRMIEHARFLGLAYREQSKASLASFSLLRQPICLDPVALIDN